MLWADPQGPLRFAALTSEAGETILRAHPEIAMIDSLVLAQGEQVSIRSTAVLQIFGYLGGVWRIARVLGRLIPKEIRDSLYDIIAHWRYRVFGRYQACPLPPPAVRDRFLP